MLDSDTPTARDVRLFAVLLGVFAVLFALLVAWRPAAPLHGMVALGVAWLLSLAFNPAPRREQLTGVLIPLGLLVPAAAAWLGGRPWAVGAGCGLALLAAALVTLMRPGLGARFMVGWTRAAQPIGWTVSAACLLLAYTLVVTPVGLLMRALGHDPLKRRFDRAAETYWVAHRTPSDASRYFRQF